MQPYPVLTNYAKAPLAGQAKTRLARGSNHRFACNAYKRMVEVQCQQFAKLPHATLAIAANKRHRFLPRLAKKHGLRLGIQPRGDLGQRMSKTLRQALKHSDRAAIIGTDCPALRPEHILPLPLDHAAVQLSPTLDGGYALIQLNQHASKLFQQINWSSGKVMKQSRRQARRSGYRLHTGTVLSDIDELKDWREARRQGLIPALWKAAR